MSIAEDRPAAPALPSNVDAEQAVIGAILVNNEAAHRVSDFLRAEHFHEPVHGRIYAACLHLIDAGQLAGPITLKPYFDADQGLAEVGGVRYLGSLVGAAVTVTDVESYGRTIVETAQLRAIIASCRDAIGRAEAPDLSDPPAAIVEALEAGLYDVRGEARRGRLVRAGAAIETAIEAAERARQDERSVGITTGLADLDRCIGGFAPQSLIIVGGRPSMGKTALALSFARAAATAGAGVGILSYEMPADQLGIRLATDVAWDPHHRIDYSAVMKGYADDDAMQRIGLAQRHIARLPLLISDGAAATVAGIRAEARRMARMLEAEGRRLGMLVIDYLQLLSASPELRGQNRTAQLSEITQQAKQTARDFNCPIVLLSQLSRALESRDDKRPTLADLRESGSIEQDADVVLFPFREAYYLQRKAERSKSAEDLADYEASRNGIEIIVAKQRNGPTRTVRAFCDIGANHFENSHHGEH